MSESGDPALIGRAIAGKYVIGTFLGGGAMGAVYRARHEALERDVAIKVMHRAVAVDASFVARFHREAKAASRLDHPNSMRVIDFGEEPDGLLYIAMEYVSGRDLYKVIHEDWPIGDARIVDVLSQALAAIAVAHDMGVIHRDLKPENIMMIAGKNDEGRPADIVKVCDFGIAKITDNEDDPKPSTGPAPKVTTQGLVVGTPEYMSPEQARGEKLDARSDLYSLGIILYQLLTGRTPFEADTALAIVLKHITDPPPPPHEIFADVNPGLEAVCLKALSKDRASRYQDARAMRVALRSALDGRPAPSERDVEPTQEMPAGGPPKITPLAIDNTKKPSAGLPRGSETESMPTPASTGGALAVPAATLATAVRPPSKGSAMTIAGIAIAMLVVGGGGVMLMRNRGTGTPARERTEKVDPAPTRIVTPTELHATPTSTPTSTVTEKSPHERLIGPKLPKDREREHAREREHEKETETVAVAPPPPVVTEEPPPKTAEPPPPPPPEVKPEPPKFNPATCHAAVSKPSANGSVFAKDLRGNPGGPWNACAKQMTEKADASATVTVRFNSDGNYVGTSCAGCPAPVSSCISRSSPGVSLSIRGGDITGEPSFTYPVTFSCD